MILLLLLIRVLLILLLLLRLVLMILLLLPQVQHLYNPWNEGKPVKIGRDGQEIEPRVAEELCRLFPQVILVLKPIIIHDHHHILTLQDPSVDMTPILRRSKEAAR